MKFENKISIDGIAVLTVAVTAALWMGNLDAKVNNLMSASAIRDGRIEKMTESQTALAISLAKVAEQVNTIDRKDPPKKP